MKSTSRVLIIFIFISLTAALLVPFNGAAAAQALSVATPVAGSGDADSPYYSERVVQTSDGDLVSEIIINGPSKPPSGIESQRNEVSAADLAASSTAVTLNVPAYNWVFGCSAVSGAMIAAYYDQSTYPNMYTGPTNSGIMPMNDLVWGSWSDGTDTYPLNPLIASRNGLDGRGIRGSIDDYWVQYNSSASDPFITGGWGQHTYGDAIGDYMHTSQSTYSNVDGSTSFYNWTSKSDQLTCANMESLNDSNYGMYLYQRDGTYGRKLFYEARGYTVADCYNQKTDNNGGGFTLATYQAQIDAGRPVMLNLEGHTVVGIGYDNTSSTIYIHDTWDYSIHSMPWGGAYEGMNLYSVSIVNLAAVCENPATPILTSPASGDVTATAQPVFDWDNAANATQYDFQLDDATNFLTPLATVTGLTSSTYTPGYSLSNGTYYWRVRARNYTASCNVYGSWSLAHSFTVSGAPSSFSKGSPANGSGSVSLEATLTWAASARAVTYEYCYDTTNDDLCTPWVSTTATSVPLSGLEKTRNYYWNVRAVNPTGTTPSRDGWYSFGVWGQTYLPVVSKQ